MSTATLTEPRKINNGQFRKENGSTVYDGPLENLPYPDHFDLDAAIESMFTEGYAVIPGVLNAQEVAELKHKMNTEGEEDAKYDHTNIGWCFNKHLVVEYHKDPHFLRYIDRPGIVDIARGVLGENCRVKSGSMWVTGPGRKMPIHVDYQHMAMPEDIASDPRLRVPILNCVCQFYLDDLVPELGPTILVPGSHRSGGAPGKNTSWNGKAPKAAMVKAGDACIFRFDLWHGAYSNTSKNGERRHIMQLEYGHAMLATQYPPMQYSHYYNPEVIKQATPAQRQLLGGTAAEEKKY